MDRRNNEGGNSFAKWHMEKEMRSWQSGPKSSGRGDSLLMVISRGESSADLAIAKQIQTCIVRTASRSCRNTRANETKVLTHTRAQITLRERSVLRLRGGKRKSEKR